MLAELGEGVEQSKRGTTACKRLSCYNGFRSSWHLWCIEEKLFIPGGPDAQECAWRQDEGLHSRTIIRGRHSKTHVPAAGEGLSHSSVHVQRDTIQQGVNAGIRDVMSQPRCPRGHTVSPFTAGVGTAVGQGRMIQDKNSDVRKGRLFQLADAMMVSLKLRREL